MLKKTAPYSFGLVLLTILLSACDAVPSDETHSITVATSFYPLTHFAREVGGDLVKIRQISRPGADPHSYEPSSRQLAEVYNADLLIFNGAGQDPWADRIYEELEQQGVRVLIATDIVALLREDEEELGQGQGQGHGDEDEHGEWDPHVWLDPILAQQIVEKIGETFRELDPENAETYEHNVDVYVAQLRQLHSVMQRGLADCALDSIIVSHDAFSYLAVRYDFSTLAIAGLSPSAEPSPARLAELARLAEERGIRHIFFENQLSPALSQTLASEIGAQTLVLHTIETGSSSYIQLQRENLSNLRTAMQCQ